MKTHNPDLAVVRMVCPDQKGLVARFASFFTKHNLNITDSGDHGEGGNFFQRAVVDISEINITLATFEDLLKKECAKINGTYEVLYAHRPQRIAIFVSRENHCLFELLIEHKRGDLPGEVALIISNHQDLTEVAKHFGIPFYYFPICEETKVSQERKEINLLKEYAIDLVVLARYMQILSEEFVEIFPWKVINVHHSFLPAFPGKVPYTQAYKRGVKNIGATAHYVTGLLDEGPYIRQETIPCTHQDTPLQLKQKGRNAERQALLGAVKAHLEGRLFVSGLRVIEL